MTFSTIYVLALTDSLPKSKNDINGQEGAGNCGWTKTEYHYIKYFILFLNVEKLWQTNPNFLLYKSFMKDP